MGHRQRCDELIKLASSAKNKIILIAPFIKEPVLRAIVESASHKPNISVYTRWRPDEIALGVSDLEVFRLLEEGLLHKLFLNNPLHAKCYIFDDVAIVGSANLTQKALGLSPQPNLELSHQITAHDCEVVELLQILKKSSIEVSRQLFESMKNISKEFIQQKSQGLESLPEVHFTYFPWVPKTKFPENLYIYYCGELDEISLATREACLIDLDQILPPMGLNCVQFNSFVRAFMYQSSIFHEAIGRFESEIRFGEGRSFAKHFIEKWNLNLTPTEVWQTIIRWLVYFASDEFGIKTYNYSEYLYKRKEG